MDIDQTIDFLSESDQLMVMSCEKGSRFHTRSDVFGDRPGDREAIECRGPTSNFVKQN